MAIEERNRDQDQITVSSAGASFSDVCFVLFCFSMFVFRDLRDWSWRVPYGLGQKSKKKKCRVWLSPEPMMVEESQREKKEKEKRKQAEKANEIQTFPTVQMEIDRMNASNRVYGRRGRDQNSQSSSTDLIAHSNFSRKAFEKNFSIGTLNFLLKTTVRRGSM
jgi:hypothetical protein